MVKSFLFQFVKIQIFPSVLLRKFVQLWVLVLFLHPAFGQNYPSRNFTTADGLPNNAIRAVHLDSRGMLWVGTEHGISKMENGEFQNFFEKDGLAFNSCWAIGEDKLGNLWFGSYGGGITVFDGKKWTVLNQSDELTDNRIRRFFPYKNWMILGTENGITLIDIETLEVTPVKSSVKNNGVNYVTGIIEQDGKVYFSTYRSGFYELFWENSVPNARLLNDWLPIYSFFLTGKDVLLADKGILHQIDFEEFKAGQIPQKKLGQSIVWNTLPMEDSKNLMLANALFTKTGGAFFYENGGMIDVTEKMGIDSRFILSGTYIPATKTLFVGTQDKGLVEVNMSERVAYFPMQGQEVNGFAGDEKTLGILSNRGLKIQTAPSLAVEIGSATFKQTQASFYQNYPDKVPKHLDGFYELDPEIRASDIDFYEIHWQNQSFWINTNIGIYQVSAAGKIETYMPVHCYSMGFTPDGKLMETSPYAGVRIYTDPKAMRFNYFVPEADETPLHVVKVSQGENHTFLASVFFGLYRWDGNHFYSYLNSGVWEEVKLNALHLMESGDLLVATEFGDVFQISGTDEFKIKRKWRKEEVIGNSIRFLSSYKDVVLIGSELGIQAISSDYSRLLAIEQVVVKKISVGAKLIGNYLYLGTASGYYQLHLPDLLNEVPAEVELLISDLRINHQRVNSDDFLWFRYMGGDLHLSSNETTLQVSFLPKDNLYPKKLSYRYRLNENAIWSDYSEATTLELPFLPPGDYQLDIEVLDNQSGKTSINRILNFRIDYPFYQNWWFVLLVFLTVAGIFAAIYKVRVKEIRLKSHLHQRMAEVKLEALRSQMNPHFIFNALNSIQYFILKKDIGEALTYLNKFSRLVRLTLTHISSNSITLKQEIDYLEQYISVENSRIGERASWEINGNAIAQAEMINISPMLIQPLVENVFAHAFPSDYPNPKLRISLNLEGDFLSCSIWDNGVGLDHAKDLQHSKGMVMIRERLKLLGNTESEPIQITTVGGTEVTIKIPIVQD
jgi:hypothetical protein